MLELSTQLPQRLHRREETGLDAGLLIPLPRRGTAHRWVSVSSMTSLKDRDHQGHAETREQGSDHRPRPAGSGRPSDVPHASQCEETATKDHRHRDQTTDDMLGAHVENPSVVSAGGAAKMRLARAVRTPTATSPIPRA